jgi:bisphosphoglycerate-dependent phosphoglycerate mutase
MTRFLLVRHGVTDWIEQELLHGISDILFSECDKNGNMRLIGVNRNSHLSGGIDL